MLSMNDQWNSGQPGRRGRVERRPVAGVNDRWTDAAQEAHEPHEPHEPHDIVPLAPVQRDEIHIHRKSRPQGTDTPVTDDHVPNIRRARVRDVHHAVLQAPDLQRTDNVGNDERPHFWATMVNWGSSSGRSPDRAAKRQRTLARLPAGLTSESDVSSSRLEAVNRMNRSGY